MKYALVQFTDDSIKYKDIKAGDFVIATTGFFWKDSFAGSVKECTGLDSIKVSLKDGYAKITKEEAEELIKQKTSPASALEETKKELEECKSKIAELEKTAADNKENKALKTKITELEKSNEALTKENETLKVKVAELEKTIEESKKKV